MSLLPRPFPTVRAERTKTRLAALASAFLMTAMVAMAAPVHAQDGAARAVDVDPSRRSVSFRATLHTEAFRRSTPPDDRYHAIVHDAGGASAKSLLVTPVADTTIARLLRSLGAEDAGGVPMAAWSLRWLPLVPQPDAHVAGTRVEVTLEWEGASRPHALHELLHDPGGRGAEMRFGGNEEHDQTWMSGCILCLFSCPGGVISNAAYSIRDHRQGDTRFDTGDLLPPDGAPVTVTLSLVPG